MVAFFIHNIFLSFWKERPMVWESSVPAALCGQASSIAQTVSMVQSGAKVVVYSSHMSLPFHQIQIWDGQCFIKSSLLEQGFVMYLDTMGNPAQSRGMPWMMWQWLELKRRI